MIRNKHNHFRELPPELQKKAGGRRGGAGRGGAGRGGVSVLWGVLWGMLSALWGAPRVVTRGRLCDLHAEC